MFERTWRAVQNVFHAVDQDTAEAIKSIESGELKITCIDGRIEINGTFRTLKINGKWVRFLPTDKKHRW